MSAGFASLDSNAIVAIVAAIFAGLSAAAAVGAIVAQYRLVPRPLWVNSSRPIREKDESISWAIRVSNRGNAPAHDVRFVWRNSNTNVEEETSQNAVLPYGKGFKLKVGGLDDDMFQNLASNRTWSVIVRWRQAPNLKKIHSIKFYMSGPVVDPRLRQTVTSTRWSRRSRY